jgi:hypothetical protein
MLGQSEMQNTVVLWMYEQRHKYNATGERVLTSPLASDYHHLLVKMYVMRPPKIKLCMHVSCYHTWCCLGTAQITCD